MSTYAGKSKDKIKSVNMLGLSRYMTLERRCYDVVSTSIQHRSNVMCRPGRLLLYQKRSSFMYVENKNSYYIFLFFSSTSGLPLVVAFILDEWFHWCLPLPLLHTLLRDQAANRWTHLSLIHI